MITTNAELETAVGRWLHRADLTAVIPDLVMLGEKRIFRDVRTRDMESALEVTIVSGVAAIPADYVALKYAYVDANPIRNLEIRSADWLMKKFTTRSSDSIPSVIAQDGANFIFGPYPDSAYTIKGTYYKRLTAVATSANALFTANPDLYLFAALCEAAPYLKSDSRILIWEGKYAKIKDDINKEAKTAEFSGGALSMRVG